MEERLSAETFSAPPPPREEPEEAVFYNANTGSIELVSSSVSTDDQEEMKGEYHTDNETSGGEDTVEDCNYDTVLLENKQKRGLLNYCPSYRTTDPERVITPFAIVLLVVLFIVYILNQADRLVLPVVIPAGLRCEVSGEDCRNLTHPHSSDVSVVSHMSDSLSNSSNDTEDCIHFNDYEQGLLTGTRYSSRNL